MNFLTPHKAKALVDFSDNISHLKEFLYKCRYVYLQELYARHVYQRPSSSFKNDLLASCDPALRDQFISDSATLEENGFVCLKNYVPQSVLTDLKKEFELGIEHHSISRGRTLEEDGSGTIGFLSIDNSILEQAPITSSLAFDPYLTKLAAYYWGKPIYLVNYNGFRYEPMEIYDDFRANMWHHDCKHKYVKIIILLTDLEPGQQCTKYVRSTNKLWQLPPSIDRGRRTQEFINQNFNPEDVVELSGTAGSVYIFDTNGYHRATRNNTARRDAIFLSYTAGRFTNPLKINASTLVEPLPPWLNLANVSFTNTQND